MESNENQNTEVMKKPESNIGNVIKKTGWVVLIIGIFAGLIIGASLTTPDPEFSSLTNPNPLRWVYGIVIIVSSFIGGISFIGFGEIINLLNDIKNK